MLSFQNVALWMEGNDRLMCKIDTRECHKAEKWEPTAANCWGEGSDVTNTSRVLLQSVKGRRLLTCSYLSIWVSHLLVQSLQPSLLDQLPEGQRGLWLWAHWWSSQSAQRSAAWLVETLAQAPERTKTSHRGNEGHFYEVRHVAIMYFQNILMFEEHKINK